MWNLPYIRAAVSSDRGPRWFQQPGLEVLGGERERQDGLGKREEPWQVDQGVG